jgi:mRNA interferase HigB
LVAYGFKHPETKPALEHWIRITKSLAWKTPYEVKATFPKAEVINAQRVRFEICGGNYRLIVAYKFPKRIAYIKFIGTHAEYDRIDATTVSLF